MNLEIENLINMAIAKGTVTDKDREIILKKAESVGENKDEIELILNGKLAILAKEQFSNTEPSKENQEAYTLNKPLLIVFLICVLGMMVSPFFSWSMSGLGISVREDHFLRLAAFILAFVSINIASNNSNRKWGLLGPLLSIGVYFMYHHDYLVMFDDSDIANNPILGLYFGFWLGSICTVFSLILSIILVVTAKKSTN